MTNQLRVKIAPSFSGGLPLQTQQCKYDNGKYLRESNRHFARCVGVLDGKWSWRQNDVYLSETVRYGDGSRLWSLVPGVQDLHKDDFYIDGQAPALLELIQQVVHRLPCGPSSYGMLHDLRHYGRLRILLWRRRCRNHEHQSTANSRWLAYLPLPRNGLQTLSRIHHSKMLLPLSIGATKHG